MSRNKGNSIIAFPDNYTIVDLETTGFSPCNDKIIEFAAIKVLNNEIIDTYTTLVNPCMTLRREITELTGIHNFDLVNKPTIDEVIDDFSSFIGSDIVVAHNANFDTNFLFENFLLYCGFEFKNDFVDTLKIARKTFPRLENHKLGTIAKHLGVEPQGSHRALDDCETLFKIFNKLKQVNMSSVG